MNFETEYEQRHKIEVESKLEKQKNDLISQKTEYISHLTQK
jgi:hypothetical protein